jgi:hypothetical protein
MTVTTTTMIASLTGGPNHRRHAATTPSMLARLSTRGVFVALPR